MTVGPFLGIDDEAECRALAAADASEPEQLTLECVRAAFGLGASEVRVEFSDGGFRVTAPGARLGEPLRLALRQALEPGTPASSRARALEQLGSGPAAGLVGLVHPSVGEVRWPAEFDFAARVHGLRPALARQRLRAAGRFAPRPLVIDGARAPRRQVIGAVDAAGLETESPWTPLGAPWPGLLALLPEHEAARATLLVHGIVRVVRPLTTRLPYEVVVECAESGQPTGVSEPSSSGRDGGSVRPKSAVPEVTSLREQADAEANAWERQAVELLREEIGRPATSPARAALLAGLFVQAIETGLAPSEWRRLPALPAVRAGKRLRVSIEDLQPAGGPLPVAEPGAAERAGPGLVLELTVPTRAALSRLLGVRFEDVAVHAGRTPWRSRLSSAFEVGAALLGRVAARPAVARGALSDDERTLLAALQAAWPGSRVYFVDGAGRPARSRRGIALPRRASDVSLAARALGRDPCLVGAAALLLEPPGQRA